jgi:hypothetical protein
MPAKLHLEVGWRPSWLAIPSRPSLGYEKQQPREERDELRYAALVGFFTASVAAAVLRPRDSRVAVKRIRQTNKKMGNQKIKKERNSPFN